MKFFDVGINEEGYWNNNQIALQVEDVYDALSIKFNDDNNVDFILMIDQSSGHGHMREGALNVNNMSVRYGGCQEKLREKKIRDVGTYPRILEIGDIQSMVFEDNDNGPFYMSTVEKGRSKYDRLTGKLKTKKSKKRLIKELKNTKGFCVRRYYRKEEIY